MKVVIDVHSLGAQAGGNETFYRQLLEGLIQHDDQNEYTLLHMHASAPALVKPERRFTWIRIPDNPVRRVCFSIPALLKRLRPDIFHGQYILPPRVGCRTVLTIHDLAHERYPEFSPRMEALRMRALVPRSARRADHIVTVSQHSAVDIETLYGIPRRKITVAYLGAPSRFRPGNREVSKRRLAEEYSINAPFILYVGRLQVRKNLVRLVEAYDRLQSRYPDVKLVLVGKPDLHYDQVIHRVKELGLESRVITPGYVAQDVLPAFYNAAEMFIFPSIFEGFGLPVMESMASGVPTITSRGSCLEEIADDGALLVDPLSIESIAGAMERLLADPQLCGELAERGLRRSESFTTAAFAGKVLDAYRDALQPPPTRA